MQVEARKVITIEYTLTDAEGEVLDSSTDDGPLTYLHGFGNIIPGLEAALEGKVAGEQLKVTVPPENAYGERDESLVQAVPRNRFPSGDIEVGMRFSAEANGASRVLTVVAVNQKEVTVDGNHPLAGQTLSFDVTVQNVRDATEEEIEHGHVHEPGHHHH